MSRFTPYQFQEEDIAKFLKQKAGANGSEMGTGKTHVAIALDELWNPAAKLPTLVIAPLNTFDSWREKYGIQSPSTDVTVINRKNRDAFTEHIRLQRGDVFLIHWDALRVMPELRQFTFAVGIADEVHRAANRKAQTTQALKKLKFQYKHAMSGTMSGDKPENLWSTLNWLYPSYYSSYWAFRKHYCLEEHVEDPTGQTDGYRKITGVKNEKSLHKEMEPFFVRHLKREPCCAHHPQGVMPWLPEKTYDTIWVDLSPTQRRFYEQMRKEMVAWVNEHEDTPLVASIVVAQLTRLSQMALATPEINVRKVMIKNPFYGKPYDHDNPWQLVEEPRVMVDKQFVTLHAPSSKIDAVKEKFKDNPNKSFVLFSSSKQACYLAERVLTDAGITSAVLSGDTPDSQRFGMTKRFIRGDFQVFIGVIEAVAEGIDDLQHATDTAIFLDRSWKTIKNKQAEDRLHRGGQKNAVQIIDVMARNTLDFGRSTRLEEKWAWIKQILGDPTSAQQQMMLEAA